MSGAWQTGLSRRWWMQYLLLRLLLKAYPCTQHTTDSVTSAFKSTYSSRPGPEPLSLRCTGQQVQAFWKLWVVTSAQVKAAQQAPRQERAKQAPQHSRRTAAGPRLSCSTRTSCPSTRALCWAAWGRTGARASQPSLGKDQTDSELAVGDVWPSCRQSLLCGLRFRYQGSYRFFFPFLSFCLFK